MTYPFALRAAAVALTATLGACTTVLLPPNIAPVVPPSKTVPEATLRLEQVKTERARIEAEYAASEQICYAKFFVNNCLDAAKEKRRSALAYQKAVEVEAAYFQRKANVEERDREVARAVKEFEAAEAARATELAAPPRPEPQPAARAPKPSLASRKASQEAKLARKAAQELADAPKRAASAAAYEERKRDSEERQREVEKRMAEKAAKEKK